MNKINEIKNNFLYNFSIQSSSPSRLAELRFSYQVYGQIKRLERQIYNQIWTQGINQIRIQFFRLI